MSVSSHIFRYLWISASEPTRPIMSSTKPMVFQLDGREEVIFRFIMATAASINMANSSGDRESPCGIPLPSSNAWESPHCETVMALICVIRFMMMLISWGSKFLILRRSSNLAGSTES